MGISKEPLIRTTLIIRTDDKTKSAQRIKDWYASGTFDAVMDTYERMGTLERHNEFLNNEPVFNKIMTTTGTWTVDHDTLEVIGTTEEGEDRMPITLVVEHGITGEVIFHCMQASSYLFRDNRDGSTTVLFVD